MKVLITYFSQTGNTEKIAKAIYDAVAANGNTRIKKIEEVKINNLSHYDVIFIGSPCHAGGLANDVTEFIKSIPANTKSNFAGFITHASPVYSRSEHIESLNNFEDLCKQKKILLLGIFDCQGFLNPEIHDFVKKHKNLSDEEWADRLESMKGHPDEEDIENAKLFAKDIIEKSL